MIYNAEKTRILISLLKLTARTPYRIRMILDLTDAEYKTLSGKPVPNGMSQEDIHHELEIVDRGYTLRMKEAEKQHAGQKEERKKQQTENRRERVRTELKLRFRHSD